jgi:hypothetical protein
MTALTVGELSLDPQNSQVGDLALRQSFRC